MEKKYSILEHPADVGIEARGESLQEAFQQAASGLMSILIDPDAIAPRAERPIEMRAADSEQLLVKWLSEILYLFDAEKFACGAFLIDSMTPTYLRGRVKGEKINPQKHTTRTDVKAITYHQILVESKEQESKVRVFLDI